MCSQQFVNRGLDQRWFCDLQEFVVTEVRETDIRVSGYAVRGLTQKMIGVDMP
jgi:hypothetical protein